MLAKPFAMGWDGRGSGCGECIIYFCQRNRLFFSCNVCISKLCWFDWTVHCLQQPDFINQKYSCENANGFNASRFDILRTFEIEQFFFSKVLSTPTWMILVDLSTHSFVLNTLRSHSKWSLPEQPRLVVCDLVSSRKTINATPEQCANPSFDLGPANHRCLLLACQKRLLIQFWDWPV